MKKIGIVIGCIFLFLVIAALVIPLVLDVDKFRPKLTEAANQNIHGHLEIGKLSLSLWGQIKINVDGLILNDASGREIISVKDVFFHIPFLSVLSGAPVLTFKMNQPHISLMKNRAGVINVMTLVPEKSKPSSANQTQSPQGTPSTGSQSETSAPFPSILAKARLGLELKNSLILYQDEKTGMKSEVRDLNLVLKDISLSHPTQIEAWANLDTKMGQTFQVKGPIQLDGKAESQLKDGQLDSIHLTSKLDMDSLEISASDLFLKKKGIPAHIDLSISASRPEVKLNQFKAQFFNAEISASGVIKNSSILQMEVHSNPIELKPWVELIPLLKEYELGGTTHFNAQVNGSVENPNYQAQLELNGLTAKAPHLKAQPHIDAIVHILPNQLDRLQLSVKAPGNDLKVSGKLISFSKPKMTFEVTSQEMNLDQLIDFPPSTQSKLTSVNPAQSLPETSQKEKSSSKTVHEDYDSLLQPLRENSSIAGMEALISVQMKMIQAKNIRLHDLGCHLSLKDLTAGIENCQFKIFSGVVKANSHFHIKPKIPTYDFNGQVAGLELKQAVESQMTSLKDTVTGKADFNIKGQGASLNPDPAILNLGAEGHFKVSQANFATIDVAKMVSEGIQSAVQKIVEKIPSLNEKIPSNIASRISTHGSTYENISSDFSISKGKFFMPNFIAKAAPKQGIDLKGQTTVGLTDQSLKTTWEIMDTYDLTQMKDVSVEQNGIKVEHVFIEGSTPFHFTVNVGCTIKAPCYSYTEVPEQLLKIALNNTSKALVRNPEVRKQAESIIKKVAPPAVQQKLNEGLNKLFH